jgi:hypothetical protein
LYRHLHEVTPLIGRSDTFQKSIVAQQVERSGRFSDESPRRFTDSVLEMNEHGPAISGSLGGANW